MNGAYSDMIHMPEHISISHPRMPMSSRAAQFSPFAALTGFDAAIAETARLTERRVELDESEKELLNEKLTLIQSRMPQCSAVSFTYFIPDSLKEGGAYVTVTGRVRRIDPYSRTVLLTDGTRIGIEDIRGIELDQPSHAGS